MKRIILALLLLLTFITTVHAAVDAEEVPVGIFDQADLGEGLSPALQPVVETIQPFLKKASVLVGGIFGLYLILIILRVHYERRTIKLLKDIRYDLDRLNMHYQIPHSRESNGYFRRLWHSIRNKEPKKKSKEVKKKSRK